MSLTVFEVLDFEFSFLLSEDVVHCMHIVQVERKPMPIELDFLERSKGVSNVLNG